MASHVAPEVHNNNKPTRGPGKQYSLMNTYKNKEEYEEKCDMTNWSRKKATQTKRGQVEIFSCKTHLNCSASCQVLFSAECEKVLFFLAGEHSNTPKIHQGRLPVQSIEAIEENTIFKSLPPLQIRQILREKNLPLLSSRQITNYKIRQKKANGSSDVKDFTKLGFLCNANSQVPKNDIHEVFVPFHQVDESGDKVCIFMSTISLLKQVRYRPELIHLDATYKMNWEGYPCVIPCISDYSNQGHPLGLAILKNENEQHFQILLKGMRDAFFIYLEGFIWSPKIIIKDCSNAIVNSCKNVFGCDITFVDCWAHVSRNIWAKIENHLPHTIFEEIKFLQHLPTKPSFNFGLELFLDKYENSTDANIRNFITYFKKEYIQAFPGWYEAHAQGYPSTNNCQEAIHKKFKDHVTFRERSQLGVFFEKICKRGIKMLSQEHYTTGQNPFNFCPKETIAMWLEARDLFTITRNNHIHQFFGRQFFIYNLAEQRFIKFINIVEGRVSYPATYSWEEFRLIMSQNIVELSDGETLNCFCKIYLKKGICPHYLHASKVLLLKDFPVEIRSIPIHQKKKRGRPKKALTWTRDADPYVALATQSDVVNRPLDLLQVKCTCENSDVLPGNMIDCDHCGYFFHISCVSHHQDIFSYKCLTCRRSGIRGWECFNWDAYLEEKYGSESVVSSLPSTVQDLQYLTEDFEKGEISVILYDNWCTRLENNVQNNVHNDWPIVIRVTPPNAERIEHLELVTTLIHEDNQCDQENSPFSTMNERTSRKKKKKAPHKSTKTLRSRANVID